VYHGSSPFRYPVVGITGDGTVGVGIAVYTRAH